MIIPFVGYLRSACQAVGLPPTRIAVGRSREEAYRSAPAALIQPMTGALRRDGSRVVAGPSMTRRRIYRGLMRFRLELYGRSGEELDQLITGVLLYLWRTPFEAAGEYQAKLDEISLSYLDDEGVLIGENGAFLDIPVEVSLYEDTPWVPVQVQVEEALVEEV